METLCSVKEHQIMDSKTILALENSSNLYSHHCSETHCQEKVGTDQHICLKFYFIKMFIKNGYFS